MEMSQKISDHALMRRSIPIFMFSYVVHIRPYLNSSTTNKIFHGILLHFVSEQVKPRDSLYNVSHIDERMENV